MSGPIPIINHEAIEQQRRDAWERQAEDVMQSIISAIVEGDVECRAAHDELKALRALSRPAPNKEE